MIARGQKLSGKVIDIDALLDKVRQDQVVLDKSKGISDSVRRLANDVVSGLYNWTTELMGLRSLEDQLDDARTTYAQAQKAFRDFLGLPDTMTPEEFEKAYKLMVQRINYRGYQDAQGRSLLRMQFGILARNVEIAANDIASLYQRVVLEQPGLIAHLFQREGETAFEFQLSQAENQDVAGIPSQDLEAKAQQTIEATAQILQANKDGETAKLSGMLDAIEGVTEQIKKGLLYSPLKESNASAYAAALSSLLLDRRDVIQAAFDQQDSAVRKAVEAFYKQVSA
jgi:hypothetical protein